MGIVSDHHICEQFSLRANLQWWDPQTRCTLIVSQPRLDQALWHEYGRGAIASYRRHGVEPALDVDALRTGADTLMFFAAVDKRGTMVAGVRAKGPLSSADDSHAVEEWRGHDGYDTVRKMIADRVPYGILEMKSAWVSDQADDNSLLTRAIARSGFHMMALLNVQFCMATAGSYVLNHWRTSGGVLAPVPAVPYPDERYDTKMMWWDRTTFTRTADSDQAALIWRETRDILAMVMPDRTRKPATARLPR